MRFSAIILTSRPASLRRCLKSLAAAQPADGFSACWSSTTTRRPASKSPRVSPGGSPVRPAPDKGRAPPPLGGAQPRRCEPPRENGCFLDDDVTVPTSYFSVLEEKSLRYPEACAIGGPNLTPAASPLFERCLGHLLGSWLGAGPMRRHGAAFDEDTWTGRPQPDPRNLSFRREALLREGLCFDEDLVRNEENLPIERSSRADGGRAARAELRALS